MTGFRIALLGLIVISAPAAAGVLVQVPPVRGSTSTAAYGINDDGVIAGAFTGQDAQLHAFFGTADGQYTTFDAGTGGTIANAIDNRGIVVGFSNAASGDAGAQPIFERKPNGDVLGVTRSGEQLMGFAFGMENTKDRFVGAYWDPAKHQTVAFRGRDGVWKSDVIIRDVHQASAAHGINAQGVVVGSYFRPPMHGFVLEGRKLTVVDYPSARAVATELEAINDLGHATGQWVDRQGHTHAFLYDTATGIFTDIRVRGASDVFAYGINIDDNVAVDTESAAYVWCKAAEICPSAVRRAPSSAGR